MWSICAPLNKQNLWFHKINSLISQWDSESKLGDWSWISKCSLLLFLLFFSCIQKCCIYWLCIPKQSAKTSSFIHISFLVCSFLLPLFIPRRILCINSSVHHTTITYCLSLFISSVVRLCRLVMFIWWKPYNCIIAACNCIVSNHVNRGFLCVDVRAHASCLL